MSTKTYTLTEDAEGHKIRKCSEYVITDEAGKVKAVSLLSLDGTTPIPLNKNFTAVTSPIVAESYATLIAKASNVTDKTITISTESAKMLAEYCKFRGKQTRNLAFGGSYSGKGVNEQGTEVNVVVTYDNGVISIKSNENKIMTNSSPIFRTGKFTLKAGTYTLGAVSTPKFRTYYTLNIRDYANNTTLFSFDTTPVTFTFTEDTDVYVGSYYNGGGAIDFSANIMIEEGTTATDFVPPLTTATTIADANEKGFRVCTEVDEDTYELLPSRTWDDVFYPSQNDSGEWLTPAKLTDEGLLNLTTLVFTPKE